MAELTDSLLVILSAASQRANGSLLPLPKSLKLSKAAAALVFQTLLKAKLAAEKPAEPGEPAWREDGETKFALKITESALKRLNVAAGDTTEQPAKATAKNAEKRRKGSSKAKAAKTPAASKAPASSGSKIESLITLLRRKTGATITDAMEATGWQAHSVRGAISGTLKKKQGLTVTSEVEGPRGRVYRIATGR